MSLMKKPLILTMLVIFTCIFSVPGLYNPSQAYATSATVATDDYDSVTYNSVLLYGELADAGSLDVANVTGYGIAYGTNSGWDTMTKQIVGTGNISKTEQFAANVTGLNSGIKYYYRAFVKFGSTYYYGDAKYFITNSNSSAVKPGVTTQAASGVETNFANLNGIIDSTGDSSIISYGFYWGTSSSTSSMTQIEVGDASDSVYNGDSFTYNITNLASGTKYYYKAYATNSAGTTYGALNYFTTDSGTSDVPSIMTQAATDIGGYSATLNALVNSVGGDGITAYGFYYGTTSSCSSKIQVGTLALSDGDNYNYTLSGLAAGTDYYYKAYAKNTYGTAYGPVKCLTTAGSLGSLPSVNTDAPTARDTAATLSGEVSSSDSTIKAYGFYYGTSSACTNRILAGTSGLSAYEPYTYNLTGLVSGATYYVKAFATNSAGTSYGPVKSFTVGSSSANDNTFTIGSSIFYLSGVMHQMDAAPYIKMDRTYIPIRFVGYALGLTDDNISWDDSTQTVTLTKGNTVVKLTIGSQVMVTNGVSMNMDAAPELTNNRTCLPVAWVAQAFGHTVDWDAGKQMVKIK